MQRWEYKEIIDPTIDEINSLGKDGWEMCGMYYESRQAYQTMPPFTKAVLYFKKPMDYEKNEKRTGVLNVRPSHIEMVTSSEREKEIKESIKILKRPD